MKNKIDKKIIKEFFKNILVYSVGTLFILIVIIIPFFLLEGVIKKVGILNVSIAFLLISILTGFFLSSLVLIKNTLDKKEVKK